MGKQYRADVVGSFLRPAELKEAKAKFAEDKISADDLRTVEDRLSLSPQCGFASCEIGNKLTEEEQWAKVDLVQRIAKKVWG